MSEPTPAAPDKSPVVAINLGRLWTLTIINFTFNVLLVVFLVTGMLVCALVHHHGKPPGRGDRDRAPWMDARGGPDRDRGPGGLPPGMPGMRGDMNMRNGPKDPPDPAKMTDMMLDRLSEKLTLTDDEKARIKPIIADQVDQMQKQREAQRTAMQKSFEDTKAKIKPLLTPDQQKQLDALPLPGQRPPPPGPDGDDQPPK